MANRVMPTVMWFIDRKQLFTEGTMRNGFKKKKTWDSDKVGAIEQNGILDESLRREVGGEAWRRNQSEGG